MKKLIGFLIVAALVGCNCMSQLPLQIVYTGETCEAPLPDYRSRVTVRDNCDGWTLMQSPLPGTLLNAANPFMAVTLLATDFSSNTDKVEFDVVLLDTIPPVIEVDTSKFTYTAEQRSSLLTAYHTSLGKEMHAAANGPDSIWMYSYLHDTSTWEANPMLNLDSTFDTKGMMMRWAPGFGAKSVGGFIEPDKYVLANIDSTHLKTLGLWPVITVMIGTEPMPIDIDAGMDDHEWYTESTVHYDYLNTGGLAEMYKSERYGDFSYRIPTGEGVFNVKLYFAEIYWSNPGERIFSVKIEGEEVLHDLDILATVGKNVPLVYDFTTTVGWDGWLDIEFWASKDLAKISGITIDKVPLLSIIN